MKNPSKVPDYGDPYLPSMYYSVMCTACKTILEWRQNIADSPYFVLANLGWGLVNAGMKDQQCICPDCIKKRPEAADEKA